MSVEAISWALNLAPVPAGRGGQPSSSRTRPVTKASRHGGWVGLIGNSPQLGKLALDEALGQEAFLLGRRSYEWLAARWPSRSGELADRLNSLPKYVVSSTLEHPAWNNSRYSTATW